MGQDKITILGIETSCDETAAAVAVRRRTTDHRRRTEQTVDSGPWSVGLLSNVVASQIDLHAATGGVVPEVAARAHVEAIIPVIERALIPLSLRGAKRREIPSSKNSKFEYRSTKQIQNSNDSNSLAKQDPAPREKRLEHSNFDHLDIISDFGFRISDLMRSIDAIAVTTGPGLVGSLLIGLETAKTLAYVFNKPIIPVNHLEGHIYANFVWGQLKVSALEVRSNRKTNFLTAPKGRLNESKRSGDDLTSPQFPALVLIVSGGHTELVLMKDHLQYELVGRTRDDAAGECFDKTARLLGLPYPGGPALSKLAEQGDPAAFDFPRPMIESGDFDFSFSGLKTAVYYTVSEIGKAPNFLTSEGVKPERPNQAERSEADLTSTLHADLAASIQQAIVDVLVAKTIAAAKHYQVKTVMISGGVAANHLLRQMMGKSVAQQLPSVTYCQPNLDLATDNAGMIAIAGIYRFLNGDAENWYYMGVDANASLVN